MNGLLKTELGFQGFVVSDWSAQHAGVATSLAGMDMTMPNGGDFWGDALIKSVKNGSVPKDRLDDMATRYVSILQRHAPDINVYYQNHRFMVSIQTRRGLPPSWNWHAQGPIQAS